MTTDNIFLDKLGDRSDISISNYTFFNPFREVIACDNYVVLTATELHMNNIYFNDLKRIAWPD